MGHRKRRRKSKGISVLGKLAIVLGILILVAAGAAFLGLRAYLRSDDFRALISAKVSAGAGVEGEFKPFLWDGLQVATEGFYGKGEGVISVLEAEGMQTEVGFGGLTRGVWEIGATKLSRIELSLDTTKAKESQPISQEFKKERKEGEPSGWLPNEFELELLRIGEFAANVKTGDFSAKMRGMSVSVKPKKAEKSYEINLRGGKIETDLKWFPPLQVNEITALYGDGSLFLNKADVSAWENGRITAFGEWNQILDSIKIDGEITDVDSTEIFNESWAKRITGEFSSSYQLERFRENLTIRGDLVISNGSITALPMLDALAAYADTQRFRMMQLNEAQMKWKKVNDRLELKELILSAEGLMRIEGDIAIDGENLDGQFMLGVIPGILARIPGAETDVFKPGKLGLLWTPVRIEGTLDNPKENLTLRLIEAAGIRMLKDLPGGAEFILKNGQAFLGGDEPSAVIKKTINMMGDGKKLLEEKDELIDEVEGLFKGLFGR